MTYAIVSRTDEAGEDLPPRGEGMFTDRFTPLVMGLTLLGWASGCTSLPVTPIKPTALKPAEAPPDTALVTPPPISKEQEVAPIPTPATTTTIATPSPLVWGLVGLRGFATGSQAAPNGVNFNPLFSLDFNFNLWLWQEEGVYAFTESRFWGQKAAPGITNASQGSFDFSKREFDLNIGAAWNYYGTFEARAFAYSQSNLNRGHDLARPFGFKDGMGLENRWYVGGTYADLGKPGFDVARATFLSVGFYPTKEMVDVTGNSFKPGPFARAYLNYDLIGSELYLFADVQAIATQSVTPKLILSDEGIAWRPFKNQPFLEFRAGSEDRFDLQYNKLNMTFYGAVRVIY